MKNNVVHALLCPRCGGSFEALADGDSSLRCSDGHSFDIAKQGYINLITGAGTKFAQDSTQMVAARDAFLEAGHYSPLARSISHHVQNALDRTAGSGVELPALVLDAGTGTGWYLQEILATMPQRQLDAIGLDISKYALRRAARRNPDAANLVWDLWQPFPVESGSADVVLVVFAPRNAAEFRRVLKGNGTLVVVTPRNGHLREIAHDIGMLGIQENKDQALEAAFRDYFELLGSQEMTLELELSHADVINVALMGPAGHHLNLDQLAAKASQLPRLSKVSAEFRISIFRARQ